MEELKFTVSEMKDAIDDGKLISEGGFSGATFLHGTKLLKLDKQLYHYLRINSKVFADKIFKETYRFNEKPFVNPKVIEFLLEKQKDIKLTQFDRGVVRVNDRICGSILTPHLDYQDLTDYSFTSECSFLQILKNTLLALRELEVNGISHLDLVKGEKNKEPTLNILYKDTDIKLCDLSDERYITYDDSFNPKEMYEEYRNVILYFLKKFKLPIPYIKEIEIENYEQAMDTLNSIEKHLIR